MGESPVTLGFSPHIHLNLRTLTITRSRKRYKEKCQRWVSFEWGSETVRVALSPWKWNAQSHLNNLLPHFQFSSPFHSFSYSLFYSSLRRKSCRTWKRGRRRRNFHPMKLLKSLETRKCWGFGLILVIKSALAPAFVCMQSYIIRGKLYSRFNESLRVWRPWVKLQVSGRLFGGTWNHSGGWNWSRAYSTYGDNLTSFGKVCAKGIRNEEMKCSIVSLRFGSSELKKEFLAPSIAGDVVSCLGVTGKVEKKDFHAFSQIGCFSFPPKY